MQTYSLMQTVLQLWKKTMCIVTIMGITTVTVMAMANMGTTRVFLPMVSAMAMTTTMVITMEIMMALILAMAMDMVKVSKVLNNRGMSKIVVYLKGNNI